MNKRKENRLTVIGSNGERIYEKWNVKIMESIQDDGRTLKLFLKEKEVSE